MARIALMSTSPEQQESMRPFGDALQSDMVGMAKELVALVEEFEGEIRAGHVPPAFAERLVELRQTAGRLIKPQAKRALSTQSPH
jgi:hypothetical protein